MKKFIPALLIATILFTGCTGPFALTKNLHKWQTNVSDDLWAEEGVFLACVIIPVYEVCVLGDAIIFNSIEFWGGENPIQSASAPAGNEMCLRSVAEQMPL
jgi:Domain of unknown function (DUF3332)